MGVLRWRSRLDADIATASSQPLAKLDLEILIALRLAVYQFLWLDRVPQRAALHESVELVKRARKRSAAPFVNAVLTKTFRLYRKWRASPKKLIARSPGSHQWRILSGWSNVGLANTDSLKPGRSANTIRRFPTTAIRLRMPAAEQQLNTEGVTSGPRLSSLFSPSRRSRRPPEDTSVPRRPGRHPGRSLATRRRSSGRRSGWNTIAHPRLLRRARRQDARHRRPQSRSRNHGRRTSSPSRAPPAEAVAHPSSAIAANSNRRPPTRGISRSRCVSIASSPMSPVRALARSRAIPKSNGVSPPTILPNCSSANSQSSARPSPRSRPTDASSTPLVRWKKKKTKMSSIKLWRMTVPLAFAIAAQNSTA